MGKINKIQEQLNIAYGDNTYITKIEDNAVVFDSTCDNFEFTDDVTIDGALSVDEIDVDTMNINDIEVGMINGLMLKRSNGMFIVSLDRGTTWYEVVLGGEVTPTERYTLYLIGVDDDTLYSSGGDMPGSGQYIPILADAQANKIYINAPVGADIFRKIHQIVDNDEIFAGYSVKSKFTDYTVALSDISATVTKDPGYDIGSFKIENASATGGDPMITITVNDPDGESGEFIVNI